MNFKESLLKIKYNFCYPDSIQNLLDNGIIRDCQVIDGIYYIEFAFHLRRQPFYNYQDEHYLNFIYYEIKDEVIYVGGMAIDEEMNILKGIIYPFYINSSISDQNKPSLLMPYTYGIPQIINKANKLKIDNFFTSNHCKVFNLITESNVAWAQFALNAENYENTFIPCDDNGEQTDYPDYWNCVSYFGKLLDNKDRLKGIKKYSGVLVGPENSVPLSFVENYLKNKNLQSSIAAKIYYNKESNKSVIKAAKTIHPESHEEWKRRNRIRLTPNECSRCYDR